MMSEMKMARILSSVMIQMKMGECVPVNDIYEADAVFVPAIESNEDGVLYVPANV